MGPRAQLAAAVRPFGLDGKIPASAVPALDALADALGLPREGGARLGALSAQYETGGRGPGVVSTGIGDPGGVSYGTYQLASKTGTAAAFVRAEGKRWPQLANHPPGSPGFSAIWRDIAAREPQAFDDAQHAFIERTHYRPVVAAVLARTGVDLDARVQPIRDAVWSIAVQHGKAADILVDALATRPRGDAATLRAIYAARSAYVRAVAERQTGAARRTLLSVVENRYPAELAQALGALA
jgi:hypothetical protein